MAGTPGRIVEVTDPALLPPLLEVITTAFSPVAEEFGFTAETAPTNPAFWTLDRLALTIRQGCRVFALLGTDRSTDPAGTASPVGTVSLTAAREPGVLTLERLAVLPAHRHRGHGRALLDHAVATARADGARTVRLSLIADNTRLERWYRDQGFAGTGTRTFAHLPFAVRFLHLTLR